MTLTSVVIGGHEFAVTAPTVSRRPWRTTNQGGGTPTTSKENQA